MTESLSPAQKEELMRNVQAQVALANMQELMTVSVSILCYQFHLISYWVYLFQKVTDKCFKKCITSPGSSLGGSDQVRG